MDEEPMEIKPPGLGGIVVESMKKHLQDKLRSHGILNVEVKPVVKDGRPKIEFFGPAEDVARARKCLEP